MDDEIIDELFMEADEHMISTIGHLKEELVKIRTGKASPVLVSGIKVDYYGTPTPLGQVANIGVADAKTITIQPWEKTMLSPIEQAIFAANIGITPMNDGEIIRISIPPLTEERRKDLVKNAKSEGEKAKVSIRNTRQKAMKTIKQAVKDGYPEDMGKKKEDEIGKMVKKHEDQIDALVKAKENDIMTI